MDVLFGQGFLRSRGLNMSDDSSVKSWAKAPEVRKALQHVQQGAGMTVELQDGASETKYRNRKPSEPSKDAYQARYGKRRHSTRNSDGSKPLQSKPGENLIQFISRALEYGKHSGFSASELKNESD